MPQNQVMTLPGRGTVAFDAGTGLRGRDLGALILLHELGHLTKVFGPDASNQKQNQQNTQRVAAACF
jgi:predicted HD phosphohydrolase